MFPFSVCKIFTRVMDWTLLRLKGLEARRMECIKFKSVWQILMELNVDSAALGWS